MTCGVSSDFMSAFLKTQVPLCLSASLCLGAVMLGGQLRPLECTPGLPARASWVQPCLPRQALEPGHRCMNAPSPDGVWAPAVCHTLFSSCAYQDEKDSVCFQRTQIKNSWCLYISFKKLNVTSFYLMENPLFSNLCPFKLNAWSGSFARKYFLRKDPSSSKKNRGFRFKFRITIRISCLWELPCLNASWKLVKFTPESRKICHHWKHSSVLKWFGAEVIRAD